MSEHLPPHVDAAAACDALRRMDVAECVAQAQAIRDQCIAEGKDHNVCEDLEVAFHLECITQAGNDYAECLRQKSALELQQQLAERLANQHQAQSKALLESAGGWLTTTAEIEGLVGGVIVGVAFGGSAPLWVPVVGGFLVGCAIGSFLGGRILSDAAKDIEVRRDYQVSETAQQPDYPDSFPAEAAPFARLLIDTVLLFRAIDALRRSQGRLEGVAAAGQGLSQVKTLNYANRQVNAIAHNAFLANLANQGIAGVAKDANRQLAVFVAEFGSAPTVDVKAATELALERDVPALWDALRCTAAEKRRLLKASDELLARMPATATRLPEKLIGNDFEKISARLTKDLKRIREAAQPIYW